MSSVAVFGDGLEFRFGEIHAAEAVVPVSIFCGDQAANERRGGSGGDGNVGAAGNFDEAEGVGKSEGERNVAADGVTARREVRGSGERGRWRWRRRRRGRCRG